MNTIFPYTTRFRSVNEAVFHHRASRTVILTDLIANFEPARIRGRLLRWLVRLSGAAHPHGRAPIDLRLTFWPQRRRVRAAVAALLAWARERVVMAPGWPDRKSVVEGKRVSVR